MAKIYIFRHGQTPDNINKIFSGWRNPDLNKSGIAEAEKIQEQLKDIPVTKAYCSNQLRARHTLEIVLQGHKDVSIIADARIKERNYGDLTGTSKTECQQKDPKNYALWHRSFDVPPPNGESIKMIKENRVLPFIDDLFKDLNPDDVVFIAASGNSIRPMRQYFEHLTDDEAASYENIPARVYEYDLPVN